MLPTGVANSSRTRSPARFSAARLLCSCRRCITGRLAFGSAP